MSWFDAVGFEADPYQIQDPPKIPLERLEWNREDLSQARTLLDEFVRDAAVGSKTSLLAYGTFGSGKTWLARIIEKEFLGKNVDGLVLHTRVRKIQPDFVTVYQQFIYHFLNNEKILKKLKEEMPEEERHWVDHIDNEDLAHALYHLAHSDDKKEVAKNWLLGLPLTASDLRSATISARMASDAYRADIMFLLITKCVDLFPSTIVVVDELENATPSLARALSDVLRDLLDRFTQRFALCCLFTGESLGEWLDYGYSEALRTRITNNIRLDSLKADIVPSWLRKHHRLYRKQGADVNDQLLPFEESGLSTMMGFMSPEQMYPRHVLANCGSIANEAWRKDISPIDAEFVKENVHRLQYRAKKVGKTPTLPTG
jgi:hypothetical protein